MQKFDERVALEAILYLAQKSTDPTFHHISKLLYFADRLHLEQYGRSICGDRYIAMKNGPVPSRVYDMMKDAQGEIGAFEVEGFRVMALRAPDTDRFSDSDLECIDESLRLYDHCSFGTLTRLSHDEAWRSADENDAISTEAIVRSLGNPDGLLEHLANPHP